MADRPGEHKARESATAARDAAESLRSPETQEAIAAAFGGDDDPRGLRDEDESGEEEPRSAEPDDPQDREEAEEPGSDYDPEEAAEGPDDDEPTPERSESQEQTTQVSDEKRQILEKYGKDPDKLADALLELEQAKSAGPETPADQPADDEPQRFTPRPGRDASQKDIQTILEELAATDPGVGTAIDELNQTHEQLKQDAERFEQLDTQRKSLTKEVGDLAAIVKHTQSRLERIPDDDIAAREDVSRDLSGIRAELTDKRNELQEVNLHFSELRTDNAERRQGYQTGIENIRALGHNEYVSRQQQIQERDESRKAYDAAFKEREQALPRVMEKLGIPKEMRDAFSEDVGSAADRMSDAEFESKVQPGRIEQWMEEVGKAVKGKYDRYAESVARGYIERKRGDADQPAPSRDKARAPRRNRDRPLSAREMDRLAGADFKKRLGAGR